ncbi:MAG: hypothetical protein R3C05_03700 [Pirellulaceae bacterium]
MTRYIFACLLLVNLGPSSLIAQQGSLLDSLRQRIQAASENQTDEQKQRNRENLEKLFSIVTEGTRQVIRTLPEDSQQALAERRKAWMETLASGVDGLTGDDIERWLANSDNVILKSLSRDSDAPSIDARGSADRLPDQWWYGQQNEKLIPLLTEPPDTIVRGEDLTGPPIWFVNGITTKRAEAIAMADEISTRLRRPVHLLHNPTFMEPPHHSGLKVPGFGTDDLSECLYDRLWPATILNKLNKLDEAALRQMVADDLPLQGNPTTRQLAHVLLNAEAPIDLITHSQGCIIARNAMYTLAMLGARQKAEETIAWIAAGIPLNDKELSPLPKQTTILDVGADPVAKIVGLRGGTREYVGSDHSFLEHYSPQLLADQLYRDLDDSAANANAPASVSPAKPQNPGKLEGSDAPPAQAPAPNRTRL